MGVSCEGRGHDLAPVVAEGLGGRRLADMKFVNECGDEIAGRSGGPFDLAAGGDSRNASQVADEFFSEFAKLRWSLLGHVCWRERRIYEAARSSEL